MIPRLLLITNRRTTPRPLPEAVRAALESIPPASAAVLLREKDLDGGPLLHLASELRRITARFSTPLIISSRWDIAISVGADGVHLGGDAPRDEDVREAVGTRLKVGVSLHDDECAAASADYAFISPVYATRSKPGVQPMGLDSVRSAVHRNQPTPLFALGGISTPEQVAECLKAGAFGVAVLGAVLTSDDPGAHARALHAAIAAHCTVAA